MPCLVYNRCSLSLVPSASINMSSVYVLPKKHLNPLALRLHNNTEPNNKETAETVSKAHLSYIFLLAPWSPSNHSCDPPLSPLHFVNPPQYPNDLNVALLLFVVRTHLSTRYYPTYRLSFYHAPLYHPLSRSFESPHDSLPLFQHPTDVPTNPISKARKPRYPNL